MIVACVFFWIILALIGVAMMIYSGENTLIRFRWWALYFAGILANGLLTQFVKGL